MKNREIKWHTWLLLSASFLLIVHFIYKLPAPWRWLEHSWEAGDLLTFVGTIALGYVAYWQTYKASKTEDRLFKIEEDRYNLELRPFVMVTDFMAYAKDEIDIIKNPDKPYIRVAPDDDTGNILCIEFSITNTTNSFITATYDGASSKRKNDETHFSWGYSSANQKSGIIPLQANETGSFVLYAPPSFFENCFAFQKVRISFILENRLAERFSESLSVIPTSLSCNTIGCSPDDKWFLSMSVQDYSIFQFDKSTTTISEGFRND